MRGIVFQRCLRVFDEARRFAPQFDESDLTTLAADTVVWAIGQRPDLTFMNADPDIEMTDRGMPKCDPATQRTMAPDVFLAGDLAHGPRLLIDAVASGKRAARSVFEYVRGQRLVAETQLVHLEIPDYVREPDYEKLSRTAVPALGPEQRIKGQQTTIELGYSEPQAVREGCRCLDCGVNTIFDSEKCILCGGCADVCPEVCLELVSLDRMQGDDLLGGVISDRLGAEDQSSFSAIIKDETKCIRCALCAQRCPTGAITMERVSIATCWTSADETIVTQ